MALNVTTAVFGSGCNTATAQPSLVQWDQGQVLKFEGLTLPSSYQVEFSGGGTMRTVPAIGDASGVEIPNALLQSSHPITAYIVLHEGQDDRETEYWVTIYVKPRQAPQTTDPDPEQIDIIDQTIAALQDGVAAAEAAAESVQNMGVEAETLPEGSAAAVEKTVDPETGEVTLTFGIPKGTHGDPGYSPTIQIATITGGHRITVTDSQGSASFNVMDGEQGDPGAPGDDGYSPAVTITQITNGHRVTITDKTHQSGQTFDVMDGEQGDPGTPGDDGYSPAVTITTITGGHRVTITDKTHPSGQTFDVMDGVIQSVNGKSAASITLDSGDIEFDDSVTYAAGSIGAEVSNAKNAIGDLDDVTKTCLAASNKLYGQSTFSVGSAGQTYQRKTFYILEKTFTVGEKYTFSCDSIVGNTTQAIRCAFYSGSTKVRESSHLKTVYVDITASDVESNVDKLEFYVYASTSTPLTQECVLTNPAIYLGYATEEEYIYTDNFNNAVNEYLSQSIQPLTLGTLEDGYINSNSGAAMSGTTYKRTGFVHVKADKLKVAITTTVDSVGFAFYDSKKKYISGFDHTGYAVGDLREVDVPENAYYFRYCAINANVGMMLVLVPNYANAISRVNTNPCFYDLSAECRTFKKILCIGDSLTAGQFDYKEGGVTKEFNAPEYAYPTFLKALTGRDTTNAGDAGETTVSWYALHGQEDFSGHDACIIMLGRNDYVSGRETTSEERATAFANIISKVRADNPQIPIFMATLINYYKGSGADTMNDDIRTAATVNNCYLLDISAYGQMTLADDAYSHCTAEGYCTLAEYFFRYISYIMHNNYTAFKTIQFVGTNRSFS